MPKQQLQMIIPVPPQLGFTYDPANAPIEDTDPLITTKAQYEHLPIIDHIVGAGIKYILHPSGVGYKAIGPVDYAPKQGWYVYHIGRKYPQPGFPNPATLKATEGPKRHLINWVISLMSKEMLPIVAVFALMPRKIKGKVLEHFLERYLELADAHLKQHYPKVEYFLPIALEIKGFVTIFLTSMGVSLNTANRFAYAFATCMDADTAYWLRVMDLLSETTKEKMMAHPVSEAQRLVAILAERDERKHLVAKFNKFAILMKFGYFFIKKPFQDALKEVEFENMQYNDICRHFVKHWTGYDFFGKTINERLEMYPRENYKKFMLEYGSPADMADKLGLTA